MDNNSSVIDATPSNSNGVVTGKTTVDVPVKIKKLRPLHDRVLVRVTPEEDVLVNGLVIPDMAKEKVQEGTVLAVGKGRIKNGERIPVDVTVGSIVTFGKYSGNDVKLNGETLLLLQEDEIQGEYYDA